MSEKAHQKLDWSELPTAAEFHEAADNCNDPLDHDALHAAGALLEAANSQETAKSEEYVERWLRNLRDAFFQGS